MSYTRRLIIAFCLLCASNLHALGAFIEPLYWRATETIDWSLTNNLNSNNQEITYNTVNFDFNFGIRIGVNYSGDWDSKFYYTHYNTTANSAVTGNVVSTFLGGKLIQTPGGSIFFYRDGQVSFNINFNMLDWDLGKTFRPTEALTLRPIVGLRGGWIYQTINTSFQGQDSVNEYVKNNFKGIGPKAAVESKWKIYNHNQWQYNIFADFTSAYMYGSWNISDMVNATSGTTIYINVGSRHMGAVVLQGIMGFDASYKRCNIKLGYEISDWMDQYQVIDDGTGARNSDLILQGLSLRLAYSF